MTWEELKNNIEKLGVKTDEVWEDGFTIIHPCIGLSKAGNICTDCGDGYCDYRLAKGMPYEDMYKIVEILHKYRSK